jgi:hypothetical protein
MCRFGSWFALFSLLASACGGTVSQAGRTNAQGAEPSAQSRVRQNDGCSEHTGASAHALEVYLFVERDGVMDSLCPGQPLTSSDALWVGVDLDLASHVRMVFVSPAGESGEVLRQELGGSGEEAVFRAPRGLFTRERGDAQLVIVASRSALAEADPLLASMLDTIRETGVLVDRDGQIVHTAQAAGPPALPMDLRSQALHADFDERGVALLTLTLHTSP